jgi:UDP-N-acetylmuramoylalanine--D-glutamate ligase
VISSRAFAGRRYAVLGLARSGLATVEALVASGAGVTAWDDREEARDDAMALGADIGNPLEIDLIGFAGVVVSPGVPLNRHPITAHAREAHVPVIGDIELFAEARDELPAHKVVGITGTNGKSTVTALIQHMLESAGVPSLMGGNIGLPILSRDPLAEGGVYVLELSSYQIDLSHSLACDVAVLTNLSPDHLDRYDGFAGYTASKARLFSLQHRDQVAIVAVDDDPSKMIASRIYHRLHRVSAKDIDPVDQARWPALQGPHNAQNAVCAIAVCRVLGLNDEQIERGLATYKSLPHRMELVGEVGGVSWFNDSKATNAASAAPGGGGVSSPPHTTLPPTLGGEGKKEKSPEIPPPFSLSHPFSASFPTTPGPASSLDCGGQGQGRRARGVPSVVRPCQTRLSDRRGDGAIRGRNWRCNSGRTVGRHRNGRQTRCGGSEAGRHRLAVAGLRVVRPVQGL